VRKQYPIVDLKRRVNVHGWKRKKTPYLCKNAKEKTSLYTFSTTEQSEQQQPTRENEK
jgi:hypothetical protein